ncbi:MAG: hypothetical protein IT260_05795 [Saprospiraceae bacterium]|nr:hypothetical protein [Saprospiraceae bacterium]
MMHLWKLGVAGVLGGLLLAGCQRKTQPEDPNTWKKVDINFKRIGPDGYAGPSDGKVVVNYEFCLPAVEKYWKKVRQIDRTAEKMAGAAGRSGCGPSEWLIIGSTGQANYQRVLFELAALPYVRRIQETNWE